MTNVARPRKVAQVLVDKLSEFRKSVPILQSLCNPALSDDMMSNENAEQIFEKLCFRAEPGQKLKDMKLAEFQRYDVEKFKDILEEISDRASKEHKNLLTQIKMKSEWDVLEFRCQTVQGKSSYILSGEAVEEIQTALDDHIIKTQTMKGSPFAKFMINDIVEWENTLITTQDNLDMWLKVQAVWMYLEPVFSSEDII